MLLTLQCCGQDTDGLYGAMEKAIARSEVDWVVSMIAFVLFFVAFVNQDKDAMEKLLPRPRKIMSDIFLCKHVRDHGLVHHAHFWRWRNH